MSKYILPTFTGKQFDLLEPTIEMINIEDAAHHLSLENRFNGATKFPISVAQHSINVCNQAPEEVKLEALLHDIKEAWYKDWTAPYKQMFARYYQESTNHTDVFSIVDIEMDMLLTEKFKLNETPKCWDIISKLDKRMGVTEIKQLCNNFPEENWMPNYQKLELFNIIIVERDWRNVYQEFLYLYGRYRRD